MKILQVIDNLTLGGAQTMCEYLAGELVSMGHEVVVVSFFTNTDSPITKRLEEKGVKVLFLDKKPGFDFSIIGKLKKTLKNEHPDAVHTHLSALIYYAVATFGKRRVRWVHTVHHMVTPGRFGLRDKVASHYFKTKRAIPVALSSRVRDSITAKYGIKTESVPVVFNGVDLGRCHVKETYSRGETFMVLHVGRFNALKNHCGLLGAFAKFHRQYPDTCLRLVGEGELRKEIEALTATLGISDSVEFAGPQSNVYPFYHDADILALSSFTEGIPMTLAEGMGTALPIVSTAVGGVPDMLTHEENALLCEVDEEQLARCFARYYEDKSLRERLGRAAKARSFVFSAEEMAKKYFELYTGGARA